MDLVLRAAAVYLLLLVISEAVSEALVGGDSSRAGAAVVVITLVLLERLSDYFSWRLPRFKRVPETSGGISIVPSQEAKAAAIRPRACQRMETRILTSLSLSVMSRVNPCSMISSARMRLVMNGARSTLPLRTRSIASAWSLA